jgi:hypothetical protein
MAEWDPVYLPDKAAEYCGCSAKTLERLHVPRHPVPSTGRERLRWGYRLSDLNALLDLLRKSVDDPRARATVAKRAS